MSGAAKVTPLESDPMLRQTGRLNARSIVMAATVCAVIVATLLLWRQSKPAEEAALAWAAYHETRERNRSLVEGTLDMGKWRAHMPVVCVGVPEKPVWELKDVEDLIAFVFRAPEPGETRTDADGRKFIGVVAGDALVSRFVTRQGMSDAADTRIREFMLEQMRTGGSTQRGYIATQFIDLRWHYTDRDVRAAVLRLAHDPDEFLAHTVRMNLGYSRDRVRRAVALGRAGFDPAWLNDREVEALAK
ncbi:MAG: hypothetical protein J0L61_02800 [Planctomycetes bacterium]|nr:hypothetical protein [Planctomycetota bacterium]